MGKRRNEGDAVPGAGRVFGVYLLHPLVVTAATRVYLLLAGDGVNYPVGFGLVAVVSLLVVWLLAYSLAQLPGLRAIL